VRTTTLGASIVLLLAVVLYAGCTSPITGSGILVSTPFNLDSFTVVEISHACDADIVQSGSFAVTVTIDDNLVQYLDVRTEGDTLIIGLQSGRSYSEFEFRATVTLPDLTGVTASGASNAELTGIFSNVAPFTLDLSGASRVSVVTGNLSFGDLSCSLTGASLASIEGGTCSNITASVFGASTLDLRSLVGTGAEITVDGASVVRLNVTGFIDGVLSGASTLFWYGLSTVNVQLNDASTAVPG
jgi:hypothetical protein